VGKENGFPGRGEIERAYVLKALETVITSIE
jgi:hypothetical protein